MLVYRITNIKNGKSYVGKTAKCMFKRFEQHLKHAKNKVNRYLYDAMNHYGLHNFWIEVLEYCDDTSLLGDVEKKWIDLLGTFYPNGYNMTLGGEGGDTLAAWSEEEKIALYKQQALKRTGERPDWWRQAISEGIAKAGGRVISEKQRQDISNTLKAKGCRPPTTILYGEDNPNYVQMDVELLMQFIREGRTLKEIAEHYNVTYQTAGARIKAETGESFTYWRKHYGIKKRSTRS